MLIFGLVTYQLGLLMALQQTALLNPITNLFPNVETIELIGVLLQFFGGFLVIAGLIGLVSDIVAIQLENEMRNLLSEILSRIEKRADRVKLLQKPDLGPKVSQTTQICKFCGTILNNEVFCSACGKSQK